MANRTVIASIEDSRALLTRSMRVLSRRDDVVIALASIAPTDRVRWNARLTFWHNICGCQLGAVSALAAIVYCVAARPLPSTALWTRVVASVGIVLVSAIAGKLLALAVARITLAWLLVRLGRSASRPALER